jgi:NADH:ubiquinone oxidoreductase subunit C
MNKEELKYRIKNLVPESEVLDDKNFLTFTVAKESFFQLCTSLKEDKDLAFDYLFNLSGVDWESKLMVVYHLRSTKHNHEIVVKTSTNDRENPEIDSICGLWKTAEFLEREVYDFFGIKFTNHPDLRRLFLDETRIEGFPFRKDYKDEINIIER